MIQFKISARKVVAFLKSLFLKVIALATILVPLLTVLNLALNIAQHFR